MIPIFHSSEVCKEVVTTWFWYSPNVIFLCKTEVSAVKVVFPGHIFLLKNGPRMYWANSSFPCSVGCRAGTLLDSTVYDFCCVQPIESPGGRLECGRSKDFIPLLLLPEATLGPPPWAFVSLGSVYHPGSTGFLSLKISPFHTVFKGVERAAAVDAVSGSTLVSQILRSSALSFC